MAYTIRPVCPTELIPAIGKSVIVKGDDHVTHQGKLKNPKNHTATRPGIEFQLETIDGTRTIRIMPGTQVRVLE